MNDSLQKLLVGAAGTGGVEVMQVAHQINPDQINNAVGLVGQIVIIVATLIGLFKKKKAKV